MRRSGGTVAMFALLAAFASGLPAAHAGSQPVNPPIERDVAQARGVVVLVHGGGWAGPDQGRQWNIDWWPGSVFRAARWNTIAIDYAAGQDGLASVSTQLADAIARAPRGRACVYGESAGGHLALLAAAELPALRCVITLGAPTDLTRWRDDAVRERNVFSLMTYAQTAGKAFGPVETDRRWEPVAAAGRIAARVLLVGQADDAVLPIHGQLDGFAALRPATETLLTEPGSEAYLHGTFSPASRRGFEARLRAFLRSRRT